MKLSIQQRKKFRLVTSVVLSAIIFLIIHFGLPTTTIQTTVVNPIIKNILFSCVFGFLPFYIIPWLRWIMGHENDQEETMDGEPKEKDE